MSFALPWLLLSVPLPLLWVALSWRGTASRSRLLLKGLALAAVLLALAQPRLSIADTKVAVAMLVDTSASVSPEDMRHMSSLANSIESRRGRNWTRLIPFARQTRAPRKDERTRDWALRPTAGDPGRGTDLELAVREAMASLPGGMVPRIALLTDGWENSGSVARAAWQARQLGVPIDTFPLAGRPKPSLRLESASLPLNAFTGEKFPIDLVVSSPRRAPGRVEITAEGRTLGGSNVTLQPGENQLRVFASLATPGALDLSGTLRAEGLGEVRFEQAVSLRRPRVLFLSQDPPGTESHLFETLRAAQFDIQLSPDPLSFPLSDYQLVVFNNWDLEALPAARKAQVEDYVRKGGGLLVIGGERNRYRENKQEQDALDRALPATLAPPRSPEGTCVVLIIDKSSSMEGRKMELARIAAIGAIENLRPVDSVGVLIFDNSFQWAVPIRKAEDRTTIKRLVAGITPDGGTQIAPALTEAYRRIVTHSAAYKHVVLLTDGISEEGDSVTLAKDAAQQRVTISTVGLGQDVNRAYLEKVASFSKGKSYFLNDPSGLEQILVKDVMEFTGSTAIERPIIPAVARQAEVLDGIEMATVPALKGYVKFTTKPTADLILKVEEKDPLFTRWQYGLGRAAVFTSDAKSRWAAQWVDWAGFDPFWTNVFRDLLPHSQSGEAVAEVDPATNDLVVRYRLGTGVPEPSSAPDIFAFGPGGFQRAVPVKKVSAGLFEGRVPIGGLQGLFRVRPMADSAAFPEVGCYRQELELADHGVNEPLLRQVAEYTGGRYNPKPTAIFDSSGRSIFRTMDLWPGLLALALALNLAELILRKWKGGAGRQAVGALGARRIAG